MGFDLYLKLKIKGVSSKLENSLAEVEITGLTEDKSGEADDCSFRMINSTNINQESQFKEAIGYEKMCKPLCDVLRNLLI